ncbi:MAG: isochorismatase family protein [Deltaproteobacteria bacterium]
MKLELSDTLFLVVDVQERLAPAMLPERFGPMLDNLKRLGAATQILDVPAVVSEQYPKGLGGSVALIAEAFEGITPIDKVSFSVLGEPRLKDTIEGSGRKSVVLSGMETHICVYQTARDLVDAGYAVHVLADAVASRTEANYQVGLGLMAKAGATITSTETVLFDLLGAAGSDRFKAISKLIR